MHISIPKKYYFIDKFDTGNIKNLPKGTCVIYRNYKKALNLNLLREIRDFCKKNKIKFLISNSFKIAFKLKLDGTYLPSFNKDYKHLSYKFKKTFIIVGSAHNIKEIKEKEVQNVSAIFISSIFKKNSNFLGLKRFKNLSKLTDKKIIALGGISEKNLKVLGVTNCYGFAGITYFKKKAP